MQLLNEKYYLLIDSYAVETILTRRYLNARDSWVMRFKIRDYTIGNV